MNEKDQGNVNVVDEGKPTEKNGANDVEEGPAAYESHYESLIENPYHRFPGEECGWGV